LSNALHGEELNISRMICDERLDQKYSSEIYFTLNQMQQFKDLFQLDLSQTSFQMKKFLNFPIGPVSLDLDIFTDEQNMISIGHVSNILRLRRSNNWLLFRSFCVLVGISY
jgi:hypothetical protein